MAVKVHPPPGPREGSGPGKGNGCCCRCCGGNPGPVPTAKIEAAGGKFVKLDDGRVVEYFVYGSEKPDAKVLVQNNGSMGTAWAFSQFERANSKLRELNIKGISLTRPGVAYSSLNFGSNLLYWAQHDVNAVLAAEGVDKFMVEGISQGSGEAMAIAFAHPARIEKMHLIVPMLPMELSKEVAPHAIRPPTGDKVEVTAKQLQSCSGCCTHCMYSCGCCCLRCCAGPSMVQDKYSEANYPGMAAIQFKDMMRNNVHNGSSFIWAMSDEYATANWGFDVRELAEKIKGKDSVLITFAVNDQMSHPDWARYLVGLFDASYQAGDGLKLDPVVKDGHNFWQWRWASGLMAEQFCKLEAPKQQTMDGDKAQLEGNTNTYWGIPVPEGFSLDLPKAASS